MKTFIDLTRGVQTIGGDAAQPPENALDVSAYRTVILMIRTYGLTLPGSFKLWTSNQNADAATGLWTLVGTQAVVSGNENCLFIIASTEATTLRYLRWSFIKSGTGSLTFEITGYGLD